MDQRDIHLEIGDSEEEEDIEQSTLQAAQNLINASAKSQNIQYQDDSRDEEDSDLNIEINLNRGGTTTSGGAPASGSSGGNNIMMNNAISSLVMNGANNIGVGEGSQLLIPEKAAQSILPKGQEVYKVVQYLDLTMNLEILLYEFHSIIYWCSVLEIFIFCVGLLLFFSYPSDMAYIFMHILHPIRGYFGFLIGKQMPKSHDFIKLLNQETQGDLENEKRFNFEEFFSHIIQAVKKIVTTIASNMETKLKVYFILTIICILFDFIEFIIQLVRFGHIGDEFSDLVMLAATCLFMVVNFFYLFWILGQRQKFPAFISEYVSKSLYGFTNLMKEKLKENKSKINLRDVMKYAVYRGGQDIGNKQPQNQ
eukprot:403367024